MNLHKNQKKPFQISEFTSAKRNGFKVVKIINYLKNIQLIKIIKNTACLHVIFYWVTRTN
jgi:hypothetical protein